MQQSSQYIVLYPDEMMGYGNGPGSYIPTLGAASTAIDQYRVVAIASTNLPEIGAAFTDVYAVSAISRIAEGGITDIAEIEAAETALQALLLHDVVNVLVPSPKIDLGNGVVSYLRQDIGQRTQFGFDLFSVGQSQDWLIAPEFFKTDGSIILSSTLPKSPLLGKSVDDIGKGTKYWNEDVVEAINVTVESHGVPAYLTDPALVRSRRGDGFSKRFYHRLRQSWDKSVGDIVPVICDFSIPPLLAIVLDRLVNRADLKNVINDLRAELAPVRQELKEFNNIVSLSTSAAEIESRIRRITESFDAIVPESRLSGAQRRKRRIMSIQGLVRPLVKFAMGFVTKGGATLEDGLKVADGVPGLIIESRAFIDRTITAKTFVGLLETESLQGLVKHHFSESEIISIQRSMRMRK
ncbi:hypothetical protein [Azospirillum sp. B506]|uniref:hypothetical protein n=1 Tax=Azospirillum sp. B506 TaxID=137721 RepID=UPI0011DE50E1|nr:hypothetical protein [Azospirillum sp. B506]